MVRQGQMLRRWCELSPRVWVYNYDYTMLVSALTPVPLTRKLARDVNLVIVNRDIAGLPTVV